MSLPEDGSPSSARRGRRRRLRWALAVVVVLGVWGVVVAVSLMRARTDVEAGLASVRRAEKLTSPAELIEGAALPFLRDADSSFGKAHDRLRSPLLAPLKVVPVVGRQLRSATAMAGAASDVSDIGADAVTEAQRALKQPHGTGLERIALLRELGRLATDADRRLGRVDLGPSRALFAPLADKRAEVADRLDDVRRALQDGGTVATGLADLLTGPRRYLVLAANNAEMRAGSGMFLSVGEMRFEGGNFSLTDFRPTGELTLPPASAPPVDDADFAARWGWLNPNSEWRNLAASPRFAASASLAARMWAATPGGGPVDGVLALDPVAFRGLLGATAPVTVGSRSITADNVVSYLLHDQYVDLPPPGPRFDAVQAARREQLGSIAKSALGAITGGRFEVTKLATGLSNATSGRHLLMWASRPEEQRVWERAGVAGAVTEDSLLLAVLNRGGNKLDQFLDVESRLAFTAQGNGTDAVMTVSLRNTTPPGQPIYVEGPHPASGVGAGDYVGLLSVTLPVSAFDVSVDGFAEVAAAGVDGPSRVVAVPVSVPRGANQTLTVRFRLSGRGGTLRVEPSARFPAERWVVPGQSWNDGRRHTVPV